MHLFSRPHRRLILTIAALFLFAVSSATGRADAGSKAEVLAIGGAVTEIAFALGQGHRLVARDTTSTHPPEARALPDVGYLRALSAEGVLSVGPSLIIADQRAGPPETIALLRASGIPYVEVPSAFEKNGLLRKIHIVGEALGVPERANALAEEVGDRLDLAMANARDAQTPPKRVLFVISAEGGRILVGGEGTEADAIIRMSGAVNAAAEIRGYKPMTDEAIVQAAPEMILVMTRTGAAEIAPEKIFGLPALSLTPAAESKSVAFIQGLLVLGFGPRTPEAVEDLSARLYPPKS